MSPARMTALGVAFIGTLVLWSTAAGAQEPRTPDHSGHVMPQAPAPVSADQEDHSAHFAAPAELPPHVPPLTDADRAAAFPDVMGHTVHDNAVHYFVALDQVEWHAVDGGAGVQWDTKGWIGRDLSRLWFRMEGEMDDGRLDHAEAHVLYGRAVARWWEIVLGARQDVRPGPAQTWMAVGLQGLAPYWFEVEATAYVGAAGRTHLRLATEYELLLTNRLILQPLVEVDLYGKSDPERGLGRGLSAVETGLRLRYELRREVAPYIGVIWSRTFFGTADLARAAGNGTEDTRLAGGFRVWF